MISVVIPVHRGSEFLDSLLKDLSNDSYKEKEIIVVISEPMKKTIHITKKYAKSCNFILNKERLSKSEALNLGTKSAKGDIFIFLDDDVKIKTKDFLQRINDEMDVDLMELKKEVLREGLISRLENYENMYCGIYSLIFDKIKRCFGIGGCGFAITKEFFNEIGGFKEVIMEDLEMGFQVYLKEKTYKYANNIAIYYKAASSWGHWFKKRKRYAIGTAQFLRNHFQDILKIPLKFPKMTIIPLFSLFPALIGSLLIIPPIQKLILIFLFTLSLKFAFLIPLLFFSTWGFLMIKNLLLFSIMYVITAIMFYIGSRMLKFNYKNREFLIYYLFYSPLLASVYSFYILAGLINKKLYPSDWT